MKTKLTIYLLFILTQIAFCQTSTQNYVRTRTMTNSAGSTYLDKVDYFDGLGRPIQTIQVKAGGDNQDLVSQIDYDTYGRQEKVWLPSAVTGNNGAFVDPISARNGSIATNASDNSPYSLTVYEQSPLNRVASEYGPGNEWHINSRGIHTTYLSNNTSYVCAKFTSTDTGTSTSISRSGIYAANELYVTKLQDEDNNISYEFKNKQNQTVLTRQVSGSSNFDTYYIYDNYGNLRVVLPPLASDALSGDGNYTESTAAVDKYAYLYQYDGRNRCIAKKLPGVTWIYYVYDHADRLIFSQDGEQRLRNEWTFTIPDAFDRTALTGICTNSLTYSSNPLNGKVLNAEWATTGNYKGYTLSGGVSLSNYTIQTVNYYDQYEFINQSYFNSSLSFETYNGYTTSNTTTPKGLLTGQITSQLGNSSVLSYETYFYDPRGRLLLTKSTNHLGGTDKEFISYAFDGLVEKRFHEHTISGSSAVKEEYTYDYDNARRLKTTRHKLNDAPVRILSFKEYDLLGRMGIETIGDIDLLRAVNTCDIRSRITWKGDTQMHEVLSYTFGSNIQSQQINTGAGQSKYEFTYDGLSRLTSAAYTSGPGKFGTTYSYDKQGNPLTIQRDGMTANGVYGSIDNLSFTYDGNRLISGNDGTANIPYNFSQDFKNYSNQSNEYSYNTNGGITKDLNRGISSIQYNILNLPSRIDIKNPVGEARNEYIYRSDGKKVRVIHRWNPSYSSTPIIGSAVTESSLTSVETTDYVGNYIYVNNVLKRILTENGYIENGLYYFHIKDHLGTSRLVFQQSPSSQAINYYPFGMSWGDQRSPELQPYKYTGKELDLNQGLNLYDYGARFYDPATCRFTTMDPMAEKYYSMSPYAYALNNPIRNIDLKGDSVTILNLGTGTNQHMGLLIQNDAGKWQYYSVNGDNVYSSGNHTGGREFDDIAVGEFNSPQQFMNSLYNSKGNKNDKEGSNNYGYIEGYIIPTSPEQDKIIVKTFINVSEKEEYGVVSNNCATAVQKSLDAIGIDTKQEQRIPANKFLGESGYINKHNPFIPSVAFKTIIRNNPQGIHVTKTR